MKKKTFDSFITFGRSTTRPFLVFIIFTSSVYVLLQNQNNLIYEITSLFLILILLSNVFAKVVAAYMKTYTR